MLPWFVDKGYAEKYGVLLTIILSISVSWILGIVSYFIIEKPCNRILLRRFVKED